MTHSFIARLGASVATTASFAVTLLSTSVVAQAPVTVVEYYNKQSASYFLTGRASEQAAIDAVPDFERTGVTFVATSSAGAVTPLESVCRYRIGVAGAAGFSSHFYGLNADCALIASYNLPNFFSEGLDFAVERPIAGVCPVSSPVAVYRTLRLQTQVDVPNHRYAVSASAYQTMLTRGWSGEGVAFCARSATQETSKAAYPPSGSFEDSCAVPRAGTSPYTGRTYPDRQGTLEDEKSWLRSWKDENYLWYREIESVDRNQYGTAVSYYDALRTNAKVPSGNRKDHFSWSEPTEAYERSAIGGASFGYGIKWSFVRNTPPRKLVVALVTPGSPAALAGVQRGDSVLSIDGADLVNGNDVATLNGGLAPQAAGESHRFVLQPAVSGPNRNVLLPAASVVTEPVPVQGVIQTPTGKVGYVAFTTFSTNSAEAALVNTFAGLQAQNVTDLVLDLRYNGGGLLSISSQLGYMIAGPTRTAGKIFSRDKFNDKLPYGIFGSSLANVQSPFTATTQGRSVAAGQPLPTLNLGRVFVLTSNGTCSASESLISGLRGIDVEVITIGATTCGKPYGFYPWDNCGTTHYSIQLTASNHKGDGDYVEGFAATCAASDDLSKQLGDVTEGQLAAALSRRTTGACAAPVVAASAKRARVSDEFDGQAIRLPFSHGGEGLIVDRPDQPAKGVGVGVNLPNIRPVAPPTLGEHQ